MNGWPRISLEVQTGSHDEPPEAQDSRKAYA